MPECLPALAAIFVHPMDLTGQNLWLMFPLSIVAAIVYKTVRSTNLRTLGRDILKLSFLIVICELALVLAGWLYLIIS